VRRRCLPNVLTMQRRIVITGMGVVTPLGNRVEEFFRAEVAGQSGVGPITRFDASTFPTTFAGEVRRFDLAHYLPDPSRFANAGPNGQFAAAAAHSALTDAGLLHDAKVERTRFGVYLGCGEGVPDFDHLVAMHAQAHQPGQTTFDRAALPAAAMREYVGPWEYEEELHNLPAHIAEQFDLLGPNWNCLTACAAGSQAIGEAMTLIRHGDADVMLAGGSHSMVHPLGVMGFNLLTALSTRNLEPTRASRPFDLRRDGFVIGEGAGMLILEELDHARRRGAVVYAELTGYGCTADAFRITDSHPEGRGAIACMRAALADARLAPDAIGHINAHGTSTQVNDRVETLAIKVVFGERAKQIPVSSNKSMLGHLIGAGGPVELITSILSIRQGVLPPTINYEYPDPACDLDYIPNTAREVRVRHVLSNSFGFGGQNVSLIVSRHP
jgi:3-oxoacyl-[acyl-carrier-protein] synthase II